MAGYKPPYTKEEKLRIIQYIIDNKAEYCLRGNAIWKEMAEKGGFSRTWQSLKEHFRKQIYPHLNTMDGLDREQLQAIKKAYDSTKQGGSSTAHDESEWPYDLMDKYN